MIALALKAKRGGGVLLVAFACLGVLLGTARLEMLAASLLLDADVGKRVTVEGTISEAARQAGSRESLVAHIDTVTRLETTSADDEDVVVEIQCRENCGEDSFAQLKEGRRVRVEGTVKEPPSTPGADFDYGLYLRRRGINVVISSDATGVHPIEESRGGWSGLVDGARRHALGSLETGGWGTAGAVLKGMVLGDTDEVPDEVISDFRDAGLLHLLAVSGQNVVLLGFIVSLFCRTLMVPRLLSTMIAMLVICVYVPLTGAGPSIVRAGVVGVLGLVALLLSRQGNRYYFLALGAAVIMSLNPYDLLDPGFQLSFAAVLAIFLVAPVFEPLLRRLPATIREAVAISAAAGLVTAPITLIHFHQVSMVTVPANIAVEFVAGPVMLLGVLSIIANLVSADLCWLLNALGAACTGYAISAAHFFAMLPGAVYNGGAPSLAATAGFYGALGGMVVVSRRGGFGVAEKALGKWCGRALALALVIVLIAGFACVSGRGAAGSPSGYTASFLDVGQGDAELFQAPGEAGVLIDGGPGSSVLDRLAESGVSSLDAVILTHPHADHLAGLIEVLKRYPVAAVYDGGPESSAPMYREFLKLVEEKGIQYHVLRQGQTLSYGELTMKVLSPTDTQRPDDPNANSIVLIASYHGLDILCPGDAEGDILGTLDLPQVDIYKVGHHGSRDSSLAELLQRIRPPVAVVSAGEHNDYGHPAEDTLAKLRQAGAQIFRTDRQGTIRVTLSEAGMEVSTEK